jgi:rod shape-determining protein MreB
MADSGYCSEKNLAYLAAIGQSGHPIDAYIATGKQQHRDLDEFSGAFAGSAYPGNEIETMEIRGRDLVAGVPRIIEIIDEEIREALMEPVHQVVESVRIALERAPPELASDIVEKGIVLAGGGALLRNLDVLLREETGLPVTLAANPLTAVVMGAGKVLDDLSLLRDVAVD